MFQTTFQAFLMFSVEITFQNRARNSDALIMVDLVAARAPHVASKFGSGSGFKLHEYAPIQGLESPVTPPAGRHGEQL
jgi:hypothetical protein